MLVEGQKPILAQKFKYYEEELFKKAVEQSQQNAPEVPEPEEIAAVQVPATKGNYGEPDAEVAPLQAHVEPAQTDDLAPAPDQVARSLDAHKQPEAHPARQKSEKPKQKKASLRSQEIVEIEIERSAAELKSLIDQAVSDPQISVARRLSIEEIMRKTVPDPDDLTPQLAGNVA
jgi:type IV secretion system protein VirD4